MGNREKTEDVCLLFVLKDLNEIKSSYKMLLYD